MCRFLGTGKKKAPHAQLTGVKKSAKVRRRGKLGAERSPFSRPNHHVERYSHRQRQQISSRSRTSRALTASGRIGAEKTAG